MLRRGRATRHVDVHGNDTVAAATTRRNRIVPSAVGAGSWRSPTAVLPSVVDLAERRPILLVGAREI